MTRFSQAADRLNKLERVVETYYRRDPAEESNAAARRAAEEFNQWAEAGAARLEAASQELEKRLASVRGLESRLEALDQRLEQEKPDPRDSAFVERFNRLVGERNAREHNAEANRRKQEAEQTQPAARESFDAWRAWIDSRGDEEFFHDLNSFYAWLHQQARIHPECAGELKAYLTQVRSLRGEVAARTRKQQEKAEHGVLILPAVLCAAEECFLVVDTAAQPVTVSPELVEALGLTGRVGEEIEVSLAGGLRTKGRRLVLPSLSVMGMPAEDVEAVVLSHPQVGVDGLLGLSYLNRFNYEVIKERPQRLRLMPKGQTVEAVAPVSGDYDVFICHRSEDAWWSHVVFDALTVMGYRPFLSEVSLRSRGESEFRKAIDAALDCARHLVVVASCAANVKAEWVEAEFLTQKRAGKKPGNIITVLCGGMTADDMPMPLSAYQAVPISDLTWRAMLKDFLPR